MTELEDGERPRIDLDHDMSDAESNGPALEHLADRAIDTRARTAPA